VAVEKLKKLTETETIRVARYVFKTKKLFNFEKNAQAT
jgi:hypothetical protein